MSYVTNGFDQTVIDMLKNGAVGVLPGDTIYGLSTPALNQSSIERLYKIKDRSENKPYIILISSINQLSLFGIDTNRAKLILKYWPGALTVIFEVSSVPDWLHRSTRSLAIRLPNDRKLQDLINQTGPIISTSANKQGQDPASSIQEAQSYFGEELDFYVDVGELKGQASTIVKLVDNKLELIRQGPVKISL
jgi:L-threonylcarbamoyladenylate synthase